MAWTYLFIAGFLEICWALGLKYTHGFTRLWPSVFTLVALAASMYFLSRAAQTLPIGTAYAIWVGIGAFGVAVLGIVFFHEAVSLPRILFLGMLLIAIIGLKFTSA